MALMTTENDGPLFWGPIPSGRLQNLNDVDKWSSLSLSYRNVSYLRASVELVQSVGLNSVLNPVVYGDVTRSINTQ